MSRTPQPTLKTVKHTSNKRRNYSIHVRYTPKPFIPQTVRPTADTHKDEKGALYTATTCVEIPMQTVLPFETLSNAYRTHVDPL